jgi:predicted outer membrane repeat protein
MVAVVLLVAVPAVAAVVHVPGHAPTIQEGLDMAAAGDTVLVAPDTYTGPLNRDLDFSGTNMVLSSGGGAEATIIDCESLGRGFRFHSGEDTTCVVRGFSIVGGSAGDGGAVLIEGDSGPLFEDCIFRDCSAGSGGAIHCWSDFGRVLFRRCSFFDNTADPDRGGAVFCLGASLTLSDCVFARNQAANSGGAVYYGECWYPGTIVRCTFESNSTIWDGGGVFTFSYVTSAGSPPARLVAGGSRSPFLLEDCVFRDNTAGRKGGAISLSGSGGTFGDIVGCLFVRNTAERGGAIADEASLSSLIGCVFSKNSADTGGALNVASWGPWFFENCTFSFNEASSGAAFVCGEAGSRVLRNLIIAFSSGGEAVACPGDPPTLTHSVVFGNTHGDSLCCDTTDNLFVDPLLCDVSAHDLTLCANSSCLPDSNAWGELIGALGEGCEDCYSAVQVRSWGSIKAMYR